MSSKTAKTVAKKATKTESTPVVQETPKDTKKSAPSKKASKKEETKTAEPVVEEQSETAETKQRRVVTRDSVDAELDSLLDAIRAEIDTVRSSADKKKTTGVKFLKQLGKRLKVLKSDVGRVVKQKNKSNRTRNTSSGFMKPVKISKDMAKFTSWDAEQLRSRVEVTKYLCNYIKDNNLQNPSNRREIVPDKKLASLLSYDEKKDGQPLTYYYMQKKIQNHFNQ